MTEREEQSTLFSWVGVSCEMCLWNGRVTLLYVWVTYSSHNHRRTEGEPSTSHIQLARVIPVQTLGCISKTEPCETNGDSPRTKL